MLALIGALGAVDDFLNARTGIGIRGRHKIIWQLVVAIVVAVYVQNHFGFNGVRVPFVGDVEFTTTDPAPASSTASVELGAILFIVVAVVAIVGCSNGVNLTDGLDGLAGGTLVFAFISFLIIALLNEPLQPNLAMVNAIVDRRDPGLPVVQRPPGPGLHGRLRARCRSAACWPSSPSSPARS